MSAINPNQFLDYGDFPEIEHLPLKITVPILVKEKAFELIQKINENSNLRFKKGLIVRTLMRINYQKRILVCNSQAIEVSNRQKYSGGKRSRTITQ